MQGPRQLQALQEAHQYDIIHGDSSHADVTQQNDWVCLIDCGSGRLRGEGEKHKALAVGGDETRKMSAVSCQLNEDLHKEITLELSSQQSLQYRRAS